ncbi:MAG: IclR family transcriptional regulator [Alphaproteobacteria bacterium]|nr:IclR family transcriptional regulator [Alphaproteobacteria bacterium]
MTVKKAAAAPKEDVAVESARYRAPALEKGLDIVELLAAEPDGLSQNDVARRLDRSVAEIFRMLDTLERRGYVLRDRRGGRYTLSLKLFELAHRHPPTGRLLSVAMPAMQSYAQRARQSAHMVVHHDGQILVVARVESPEPMGFSVRMGAYFPFRERRISARVLAAFQPTEEREALVDFMLRNGPVSKSRAALVKRLDAIRRRGYETGDSDAMRGITDTSYPIFAHGGVAAALTSPCLVQRDVEVAVAEAQRLLAETAAAISRELGGA